MRTPRANRAHGAEAARLSSAALVLAVLMAGCAGPGPGGGSAPSALRVGSILGDGTDTEGYARALEPRPFSFPADHGPHPDFQSEWWYFVGNLSTAGGRRFGFQLTFFRFAVAPDLPERSSRWASRQVWMAHLAVTDVVGRRFHAFERFRRGALGLAGGLSGNTGDGDEPFRVWLDDWRSEGLRPGALLPLRLHAATAGGDDEAPEVAIDLTLSLGKPPVPQGENGLSRKGPEPGNASYYYSLTRLPAAGTVSVEEKSFEVSFEVRGTAWLDHEWSTSALSEYEVGWDWFSLQLTDAGGEPWELMLYRIRREDGTASPTSEGSWVTPDGGSRRIAWEETEVEILDHWTSPATGTVYPSGWRIRVPDEGLDLTVRPLLRDQELDLAIRYWEGAVAVEGTKGGEAVTGRGYVELTGYGEAP
jgi:predicted secreted hydrolase